MEQDKWKGFSEFMNRARIHNEKLAAERKKLLALEEEYFVSRGGSLLVKFPECDKFIEVYGFDFYMVSAKDGVRPFSQGEKIEIVPNYVMPILNWEG